MMVVGGRNDFWKSDRRPRKSSRNRLADRYLGSSGRDGVPLGQQIKFDGGHCPKWICGVQTLDTRKLDY